MSDADRLLERIEEGIDGKPICMTCQAGVAGGDAAQGYSPGDYGLPGLRAKGDRLDLTKITMYPCIVPNRGVSDQTMEAAMAMLQNMVERNRPHRKKPWWKFW